MNEHRKHVSDGSTASYYAIPPGAKELSDCIEYKNMNFQVGNIFKACYRLGEKDGTDLEYDLRKIGFFWLREMFRLGIDPRKQLELMDTWANEKFDGALNSVDMDELMREYPLVAVDPFASPKPRYANKSEVTTLLKPDDAGWFTNTWLRPLHDAVIDVFSGGAEGNIVTGRCDSVDWDNVLLWRYADELRP